jgi:hypothetical protein
LACALRSDASLEGLLLPNGERILYSGYADDTTLFVSKLQDLDNALKIFDKYSSCSRMRLNLSKSWVVPLGTTINDVRPIHSRFKWLTPSDQERLLGVPVKLTFDSDSAWDVIVSKMADSIKHWTSQNLSIFGRVHAAKTYVGSKSWYLATMIFPKSKCLQKLTAMLWSFL